MAIAYSTSVASTGGRDGSVRSANGVIDLQLAVPKEMGGPGGDKPNPEMLFAAGYAACFHGALKLVAGREKVSVYHSTVTATVGIGPNDAGGFGLAILFEGFSATEIATFFEQTHLVAGIRESAGGRETRKPAADHDYRTDIFRCCQARTPWASVLTRPHPNMLSFS